MIWKRCGDLPYEASSDGRIRRLGRGNRISQSFDGNGYLKVTICVDGCERTITVHRLVALAFHGSPPEERNVVNHLDGNKASNRPENLEYTTHAGNSRHAVATGLAPTGARHGRHTSPEKTARGESVNTAKVTVAIVVAMRKRRDDDGASLTQLMREFGLSKSATWQIIARKNWRHVA